MPCDCGSNEECKCEENKKTWMDSDRERDIKKFCNCKCEPRCCTLPSIDIDVEDCSSVLSGCTGENCRKHERVVEFEPDMNLTIH